MGAIPVHHIWRSVALIGPLMLPAPCGVGGGVGCLRGLFNPPSSPSGVVVGFGLFPLPPWCGVVWCGGGLWVSGLVFILLPPSLWCGSGWWVLGSGFAPAPPLWCGWCGCLGFKCIDMNVLWLRVSSWAQRRPKPWPIQEGVATLDTPRSCIASKVTALTRIPGSGGGHV